MDCEEFRSQLDGSPSAEAKGAAGAHLASCAACRRSHARAELSRRILVALPRETPDPGLDVRVLALFARDRRPGLSVLLRAAAALLLLGSIGLGFLLLRAPRQDYEPIALRVVCESEDGNDAGEIAMEEMFGPETPVAANHGPVDDGGSDGPGR